MKKISIPKVFKKQEDITSQNGSESSSQSKHQIISNKNKSDKKTETLKTPQKITSKYISEKNPIKSQKNKEEDQQNLKQLNQTKKLKKYEDDNAKLSEDETEDVKITTDKYSLKQIQENQQRIEKSQQKTSGRIYSQKKISRNSKRPNKLKETQQKLKQANQIILAINESYEEDVKLFLKNKTADKKLKCMIDIQKKLKDVIIAAQFMKQNGYILFIKWLSPNQISGQQTSLTVKIKLLNLILDLNFTKQNIIEAEQLQKEIKKYRKSRYSSLRGLSDRIINKWRNIKALPGKN